ncbi:CRISPR-associated endonuclease Cas2 [Caminibacter pacificus]
MYVVVTYDISNNKQRNKLAKELLVFGIRTQKSFFECEVTEKELKIIKKILKKYSQSDDFVTIYNVKVIDRIGDVEYLEIDDLIF